MEFSRDDKLKAFLKKESRRLGISITNTYNTFFSLQLLKRISETSYDKLFVKGSFSELAHLNEMIRPITDIDLVSSVYHNDPLLVLYKAMYSEDENLHYELMDIPKKTKTGIYKIHIKAIFGSICHPISIDFQELSNTIYQKDYKRVNPLFTGDDFFYIYTPTYEEHLAEKLCIVVESNKNNILNTRVKDFYDIYKLKGGKYDKEKLSYFFYHMLLDRHKIDISHASVDHLNSKFILQHQQLWDNMSRKYEFTDKSIAFEDAVETTKGMLNQELSNLDNSSKIKIKLY